MSDSKRLLKIAAQIKEHIATMMIKGQISDPRCQSVLITQVKVSPDVGTAKVYYALPENPSFSKKEVQEGLTKASGFIRKDLSQVLTIRHTPALVFYFDETIDYMAKMNSVFAKVKQENEE